MNRKLIIAVVVLGALAGGGYWYTTHKPAGGSADYAASGTVEATEAALGFQAAGRITHVNVREGDVVKAGDELARLDRSELEARQTQAKWQLAAAKALLAEIESGSRTEELSQAREGLTSASDRVNDAKRDYDRTQKLVQGGAMSQDKLDKAKLVLDVATSQRVQAEAQLRLVEKGPRQERRDAQKAVVSQAEAAVKVADAALANAAIHAPFAGVVAVRDRQPGETVPAGAPVLTIVDLSDRWIRIYIRENQIGAVSLGQGATITSDTYPGKTYTGVVSFISNQAEFTPRNVQTTEERVKLVYAVKVRITGDGTIDLKPGMPADVKLVPHTN